MSAPTATVRQRFGTRRGGLAAWSAHHPIGVVMIALAVVALGILSVGRLGVDLLPQIIYPEIGVRVADPGVPAEIIEDRITRILEEQLAITEDAVSVESTSTEGRSAIEIAFPYGKNIDEALRDASTRLDRARRLLPTTIDQPAIFKRDPSQIPVAELVVSSRLRDAVDLREYVDYRFSSWFLNLPGVAAVEVGGGLGREIQVLPDQRRLAALGLDLDDVIQALERNNQDSPGGRLELPGQELLGRTAGRFESVAEIAGLPLTTPEGRIVRLGEVAEVIDGQQDERLLIRLDDVPGIKVSIQKQPTANTVAVVEAVRERLDWLSGQSLIPDDLDVRLVDDQSVFVRAALNNAVTAVLAGSLLAMTVVFLFLGNLRRTLIIGSAIPIAILVTFILMGVNDLTFNIMTLGGLALGVGLLVDSAIVMLENIQRHQQDGEEPLEAATSAAAEVNSALVASTSTNLAAVLPFLFVGGLTGLLFQELIITLSCAIFAALIVALTLVPALAARVRSGGGHGPMELLLAPLRRGYVRILRPLLRHPWWVLAGFIALFAAAMPVFFSSSQIFLPNVDEGNIRVRVTADPGLALADMDETVRRLEALIKHQPEVQTVFSTVGGAVFGANVIEASNRADISVQLAPGYSSSEWIGRLRRQVAEERLAGVRVFPSTRGIRGIRIGRGGDDLSIRVQGPDLATLATIGDEIAQRMRGIPGLRNVQHSYEDVGQELAVRVDRERAADVGMTVGDVGRAFRLAVGGQIVTEFLDGDRSIDVRVRLPRDAVATVAELEHLVIGGERIPIYLGDVARVELVATPTSVIRDNQQRIVEISASLDNTDLSVAGERLQQALADYVLPQGYAIYEGGALQALRDARGQSMLMLGLALFLVLVVMAVQYESLRNPLLIMSGVPFSAIGVALAIALLDLPLSMPLWLGLIMLAGIVVNNAIVLVETIEIRRERGLDVADAVIEAARLRLRPILMTTLTTVMGMLPLALGLGRGSELLEPLAIAIVAGLSFSVLVSLLLIPTLYRIFHAKVA